MTLIVLSGGLMKRKASTHERLAERLANILTKLNTADINSGLPELAAEFQVSTRTIERDFRSTQVLTYLYLKMNVQKRYYWIPAYLRAL